MDTNNIIRFMGQQLKALKERPWPYGDVRFVGSKVPKCPHCGKKMTVTFNVNEDD